MENTKKEYIDRLKKELDSIEGRYLQLVNDNIMVGEDYRS
jgi:septum formation topological specificity factor MinE